MGLPHHSPPSSRSLLAALSYSHQFDYPLSASELWYWQVGTSFSLSRTRDALSGLSPRRLGYLRGYYFLPGKSKLVALRLSREKTSRDKWKHAQFIADKLRRFPTIAAVFVTGALSMSNSPPHDDIDIMIVTLPHTLWFTRLFVVLYLNFTHLRRPPYLTEHASPQVSNKICDNLYLDLRYLHIPPTRNYPRDLYLAHEILQAKCLFDHAFVSQKLLSANPWVAHYLPVAYQRLSQRLPRSHSSSIFTQLISWLLFPVNLAAFTLQYVYMRRSITTEHIGEGFAFFHPRPVVT